MALIVGGRHRGGCCKGIALWVSIRAGREADTATVGESGDDCAACMTATRQESCSYNREELSKTIYGRGPAGKGANASPRSSRTS